MKIVPFKDSTSSCAASSSTSKRQYSQPTLSLQFPGTKEIVNEIIWTIHMTMKDSPDTEIENDTKALQRLAPNDLKNFKMSRKKFAYTKKSIGDWFWEEIVFKDVKNSPFALMFDDTTNTQHNKELQLVLKYWSLKLESVNFVHLKTAFLSSGKAIPAVEEIKSAIKDNSLISKNLVQLGSDGPNVTKSIKTKINEWLKTEEGLTDLFDLGSCHDHNLHNALKFGCEEMKNVHVLCQQVSEHFKSSSNWESFAAHSGADLKFITFFSVRWTTLGPASERIIKYWNELKAFFGIAAAKPENKQTKTEKKICSLLLLNTMLAEILFIRYSASLIEPVLTFLEQKDQIIFKADDVYTDMLEKLVAVVMMPGEDNFKNVILEKSFPIRVKSATKVTLPETIEQSIPATELKGFHQKVFIFTKNLVNYLNRKDFFHPFLYDVKFLSPSYIFKEGSIERILAVADYFKPHNQIIDKTKLFEELTLLVSPRNQDQFKDFKDIDKFYVAVNEKGQSPETFNLFRLISALTISNAEVERQFSRSKLVITKQMSNLQEENFNSRKRIISGMKFFQDDISNFPVSTSMISKVHNAHRDYKRKHDDEKSEHESKEKRQRADEELTSQIRSAKQLSEIFTKQIESKVCEVGKIQMDLKNEKTALNGFLDCMASCKDQKRLKELIEESQLSTSTISALEEDLFKIQNDILKLQEDRIKKLTSKV